ncbi:hypothetical protein AGDE_04162 [Angomonas deanei]|uniref:Uncharacterized protein n=1 Tax=Angomonas deanei TaxID=59799 RepID=A0A7G2CLR2_9TRYP|nr:hypothetical protein AGDE_04162 [Angomonas deanei]CAD2220780.1 hypothetical protein, conserved [Angomonas deanei]|eukprot:EPY39766.1 hypothetical protein AGDE_04162 [Angomonas deanei]
MRSFLLARRAVLRPRIGRGIQSAGTNALTPSDAQDGGETAVFSPFLEELLHPPDTIPLEDATRQYTTMDVVPPLYRYDPNAENVTETSEETVRPTPVRDAWQQGKLWSTFATQSEEEKKANAPPGWFKELCYDLYSRKEAGVETAAVPPADYSPEAHAAAVRADATEEVDPYLWLPFQLKDESSYAIGPYQFAPTSQYNTEQQVKLCLGDRHKEYVHFCDAYPFPERHQLPTSVGTVPSRLHVDPTSPHKVVYVQLSPDFPPALWLPVKGTAAAVRRVLASYASQAALHRDHHHEHFEQRYRDALRVMELQNMTPKDEGDVLRFVGYESRNVPYTDAPLREYRLSQTFYMGEHDDPEKLLEHLDLCPTLFAIPSMRTVTNPHAEHMIPTVEGPGVVPSLYRCIYSKALLLVQVSLSAEVKLPPQDPEVFKFLWKDTQVQPQMKLPVFVKVMWPDDVKLSGNGVLNRRFNRLFNTEFAEDIPPDALYSVFYTMHWAGQLRDLLGVRAMRERVAELLAASQQPAPPLLYPGTREVPNPEYTIEERLGMHLQYLSYLGDPLVRETIENLLPTASAPVRMGCAKAALIAGERDLFRRIVSSEPQGRMQHYMTKLARKRKTRDLVDPEPRLLEGQYEFASPLWTKRNTRIDRNTLEGAVDMAALKH